VVGVYTFSSSLISSTDRRRQTWMFQQACDRYGRIDALCANTGIFEKRHILWGASFNRC
jgi:hypothetical protein